ncbi:MAG: aminotransferase class III-fold pyridoxal phosphate-dependent enzyme [Xanthomonadales bacterium]
MNSADLMRRRERALGPAYRLFYGTPLHVARGSGVWLYDVDGRRYLDCYNNVAVVGHAHPAVVEAMARQAGRLNTHTRYLHEGIVDYAERLAGLLPDGLDVCMFTCTGTEANDLALRMARAVTGHAGAVTLTDAYHGHSAAVYPLSTEDCPDRERPPWVAVAPAPDEYRAGARDRRDAFAAERGAAVGEAAAGLAAGGHGAALFLCDTAFSSNGVLTPPPAYLQTAFREIRRAGGLAVADEVQAGLWRLGDGAWGFEASDVAPDIVTLGKPLGAGYPLAALVTRRDIAEEFAREHHYFNTFGGSPVAAAVGSAVLDVIEREGVPQNVQRTGRHLADGLNRLRQRHPLIGDVRGRGLFFGIELVRDRSTRQPAPRAAERVRDRLRENGVLLGTTGSHGNVLKIRPPLVFERRHADRLLETLDEGLAWAESRT